MKKTILLAFIAMLSIHFSCKKDSNNQVESPITVFIKPAASGKTDSRITAFMMITRENGQVLINTNNYKPSNEPINSTFGVKVGENITLTYHSSHTLNCIVDLVIMREGKLMYSFNDFDLKFTGGSEMTITVK